MAKTYLVWNENKTECVGFKCKDDAEQAAGLLPLSNPCSTLALEWREAFAYDEPDTIFEMEEVSSAWESDQDEEA